MYSSVSSSIPLQSTQTPDIENQLPPSQPATAEILGHAVRNPAADHVVTAARQEPRDGDEGRTCRWAVKGAVIGAIIGAAVSLPVAFVGHHNDVKDLSASPFEDIGDKTKADLKRDAIAACGTIGGTVIGAALGAVAGRAADLCSRCVQWWRS